MPAVVELRLPAVLFGGDWGPPPAAPSPLLGVWGTSELTWGRVWYAWGAGVAADSAAVDWDAADAHWDTTDADWDALPANLSASLRGVMVTTVNVADVRPPLRAVAPVRLRLPAPLWAGGELGGA